MLLQSSFLQRYSSLQLLWYEISCHWLMLPVFHSARVCCLPEFSLAETKQTFLCFALTCCPWNPLFSSSDMHALKRDCGCNLLINKKYDFVQQNDADLHLYSSCCFVLACLNYCVCVLLCHCVFVPMNSTAWLLVLKRSLCGKKPCLLLCNINVCASDEEQRRIRVF